MFPKPLRLEKRLGKDEYYLIDDFEYTRGDVRIAAPAGMWTDLCSWPRTELDFGGVVGAEAGVLHDYLYRIGAIPHLDKGSVDLLFYRMLRELGVSLIVARGMYRAVQLFGHKSWKQKDLLYQGVA
jgi:hypothetical protein